MLQKKFKCGDKITGTPSRDYCTAILIPSHFEVIRSRSIFVVLERVFVLTPGGRRKKKGEGGGGWRILVVSPAPPPPPYSSVMNSDWSLIERSQ